MPRAEYRKRIFGDKVRFRVAANSMCCGYPPRPVNPNLCISGHGHTFIVQDPEPFDPNRCIVCNEVIWTEKATPDG